MTPRDDRLATHVAADMVAALAAGYYQPKASAMNPLRLLKLYKKVNRLVGLFQEASASYERTGMASKSLWVSKVFWINILSVGAEVLQVVSGLHVAPAGAIAVATNLISIALRAITSQPVHVVSPR